MKISALLYAVVIIAFFMPFFMVSCEKTELLTINGIQLVTGGESKLQTENIFAGLGNKSQDEQKPQKIKAQPMAMIALALAVIALIVSLLMPGKAYFIPVILSVAGVLCLHLLKNGMIGVVSSADTGMGIDLTKILRVKALYGFWMADAAFLVAAVFALVAGFKYKNSLAMTTVYTAPDFEESLQMQTDVYHTDVYHTDVYRKDVYDLESDYNQQEEDLRIEIPQEPKEED